MGVGIDTDGRIARYQWDFESDGKWDYESSTTGTTSVIYDLAGTYTATLRVTDDDGATATDTATVIVTRANALPTVSVAKPVSGEKVKGYVVFAGTAADDVGVVKVEVQIDSRAWDTAQGTLQWTYDLNADTLSAGTHTLRARAVDTNGETSTETVVQFTVEGKKKASSGLPGMEALAALAAVGAASVVMISAHRRRRAPL
jgi:VCBS repeat-containing protein